MPIPDAADFTEQFEKVRGRTLRVARSIPRDKMEWTFREGRFTFGDILRHLAATERYMWAENARFHKSPPEARSFARKFQIAIASHSPFGFAAEAA